MKNLKKNNVNEGKNKMKKAKCGEFLSYSHFYILYMVYIV